ncbi:MAG: hypothetical protein HPY75_01790 [Actinobacteria bacterium]|nr:hypothetical protein [Actinomycetota bacterium]
MGRVMDMGITGLGPAKAQEPKGNVADRGRPREFYELRGAERDEEDVKGVRDGEL